MIRYSALTKNITVTVMPVYLDGESSYMEHRFVFAYFITITNEGRSPVRLRRRFWMIKEENGKSSEVEGEGVVGEQPLIHPGRSHRYNSFCILNTPRGSMEGHYTMEDVNGEQFPASIPRFNLRAMAN